MKRSKLSSGNFRESTPRRMKAKSNKVETKLYEFENYENSVVHDCLIVVILFI